MLIPVIRIHISVLDDGHLRAQTKSLRKECFRTPHVVPILSQKSCKAPSCRDYSAPWI